MMAVLMAVRTALAMAAVLAAAPAMATPAAIGTIPGVPVFSPSMKLAGPTGEVIHTFRIPSLLRIGQTKTLLAFAEGRATATDSACCQSAGALSSAHESTLVPRG